MPNYFYTDANGNKRGPVTPEALKAMAAQRIITPNTPLETDGGHKGLAGQISGLFNVPPTQPATPKVNQTAPPSVPIPVAEGTGKSSWLIAVIGIAVLLIVGTIGWSIINTPSATVRDIELAGNQAWFSPDGKKVVTKVADNSYVVWDAESGKELQKLEGLEGAIYTFSQDSKKIFMRGTGNTLRMWDINSGMGGEWMALDFVHSHQWGTHFQISPDGKRIIHRTGRDAVPGILWDPESGRQLQEFTFWDGRAIFSPDGKKIAMDVVLDRITWKLVSLVLDAESGKELLRIEDDDLGNFSPDGKKILGAHRGGTTRILDVETGNELQKVEGLNSFFFPDGKKVVTSGGRNNDGNTTYRIWDIESGMKLQELESECGFHFSSDGKRFLTYVDVWDENNVHDSGRRMFSRIDENKSITRYFTKSIVRIWDAQSVSELHSLELLEEEAPSYGGIAISHDGKKIIIPHENRISHAASHIWDAKSGKKLYTFEGERQFGWTAGQVLSVGTGMANGQVKTSKLVTTTWDDERRGHIVRIWDINSGRELQKIEEQFLGISPDERKIATTKGDGTVRIWKL